MAGIDHLLHAGTGCADSADADVHSQGLGHGQTSGSLHALAYAGATYKVILSSGHTLKVWSTFYEWSSEAVGLCYTWKLGDSCAQASASPMALQ